MKVTAKVIPFSSVVGTGLTLHDDTGRVIGQLSLQGVLPKGALNVFDELAVSDATLKEAHERLAERIARAINAGQPERQIAHTKRGSTYDVVASRALLQISTKLFGGEIVPSTSRVVCDGDEVTVYRNEHGIFVRFLDEMVSPRFEDVGS